jgi:hypothetical protein
LVDSFEFLFSVLPFTKIAGAITGLEEFFPDLDFLLSIFPLSKDLLIKNFSLFEIYKTLSFATARVDTFLYCCWGSPFCSLVQQRQVAAVSQS